MKMIHFFRANPHRTPRSFDNNAIYDESGLNIPVDNIRHNLELLLIDLDIDIHDARVQKDLDCTVDNIVKTIDVHYMAAGKKFLNNYIRLAALLLDRANRHRRVAALN